MRRCPKAERRPSTSAGFTLVEIAVVIVVLSLLLAMIAGIASAMVGQQRREVTRQKLAGVEVALALFVSQNRRLPCPADGRLASDDANAGLERPLGGLNCNVAGAANSQTHGVVPWRTLGLAEGDITDGWGNRLTYRVAPELVAAESMNMTNCDPGGTGGLGAGNVCNAACSSASFPASCTPPPTYTAGKGLGVRNLASATLIMNPAAAPSTGAAYVVISHGENLEGAYNSQGVLQAGSTASGTLESANNASSAAFVASTSAAAPVFVDDFPAYAPGNGHFDDFLLRPSVLTVVTKAQLGPRAH